MHTFLMSDHERVFAILITPSGVDALLVSQYLIVNDVKYDYSLRTITLMSLLILHVLTGKTDAVWLLI